MIPISAVGVLRRRRPVITLALILINALVFFYELTLGFPDRDVFFLKYGLIPAELRSGLEYTRLFTGRGFLDISSPIPTWGTVFTSMFIHGGWLHFLGNMLYLWVFGANIEDRVGHVWYIVLYLASGVAATWTQASIDPASEVPMVGASGAIAGVLGASLITYPFTRIRTLVVAYFITAVNLPAALLLGIWFVMQLFSGVGSLGAVAQGGGVAYWAHIGGFMAGILLMALFRLARHEPVLPRRPRPWGWG